MGSRKRTLSIVAVLILTMGFLLGISSPVSTQVQTKSELPGGYNWKLNPNNGHYYTLSNEKMTWDEAKLNAENLGGYLATITSQEELDFLYRNFLIGDYAWIGLIRTAQGWAWLTGETMDFTNWHKDIGATLSGPGYGTFILITGPYQSQWTNMQKETRHFAIIELDDSIPPIQTPTPTPTSAGFIPFDGNNLSENQLVINAPAGFTLGNVSFGEIPTGNETDGQGVEIHLAPGQGAFIVSNEVFDAPTLSRISGLYRATSSDLIVALIALNSPIDGQIGYTNISSAELPVEDYRQLNLYYTPPSGKVQLGIQAVNSPFSTLSTTLWVDNLKVKPITPILSGETVSMAVDGNFESGLGSLITNFNNMDGTVTPFFESLSDIAVKLAITPDNTAANIGNLVTDAENIFPLTLLGEVSVFRDSPLGGGGLLAFVMTNGFQNTALFRHVDELPGMNSIKQEHLIIGSDFTVNNPNIPIHVVVQNGGPDAESSVVIDDMQVIRYEAPVEPIPTPTPDPTDPTVGAIATASSVDRPWTPPSAAIDGDFNTRWDASAGPERQDIDDPEWWQIDFGFGNENAVRQIRMYQASTANSANLLTNTAETVSVLYSDDGEAFFSAGSFSSLGVGLNPLDINFVGVHRYWRIATEDSNNTWGVFEFEFEYY